MPISYWCLPAPEDMARLGAVGSALAKAQKVPAFQVHLTLGTVERAIGDVNEILATLKGLTLIPVEIDRSERFTMSLFLRVGMDQKLSEARERLEALSGANLRKPYDPHISLLYGDEPRLNAEMLEAMDALLKQPIKFDRLAGIEMSLPIAEHGDVARWKTISEDTF